MFDSYKPSGQFSPLVFATFAGAAALAVGVAFVYDWLMSVVPFIYLNAIFTAAFAFGLLLATDYAVRFGKCRNRWLAVGLGALVGVVTLGAAHYFAYRITLGELAGMPQFAGIDVATIAAEISFWDYIDLMVENGWKLDGGAAISGPFVWAIWGIEAVALVGASGWGAWSASGEPFCEDCGAWASDQHEFLFPNPSEGSLEQLRDARDPQTLVDPTIKPGEPRNLFLSYLLASCPSCAQTNYLSVTRKDITIDNEGNENVAETDFYAQVALDAEQAKSVVQIEMVDPATEQQDEGEDGQTAEAAEAADGDPPGPMAAAEGDGEKPGF